MHITNYLSTMWYLLKTDLIIFTQTIWDKLIDLFIWVVTMVLVTAYLMPAFGLAQSYSAFLIASLVGSAGMFELYASATNLISDFDGNNITSFYLTLPIPSWLVWIEKMIYYTLNTTVISIFILPISKILVWKHFDLAQFNLLKFVCIFMLTNIFYSGFTLWVTSRVPGIQKIGSVWMRFVYPLWFLGGFQFSYYVLHRFNRVLGWASLINPMMYVMEGTRAAVLGPQGSLNIWLCVGMLALFTVFFTWHALRRLKRRLDYI